MTTDIRIVGARENNLMGNTVVVIEHDLAVIEHADWVIDLGPDGGRGGGEVVFTGTPEKLLRAEDSLTAEYLRRRMSVAAPTPAGPRISS